MNRFCSGTLVVAALAVCVAMAVGRGVMAADAAKPVVGTIKGLVKYSDGSVAGGVKVELFNLKDVTVERRAERPTKPPKPVAKATTDADGNYTLEKVPPGQYRLNVGDVLKGMAFVDVSVEAGKTVTKNVTVRKRRPPGL